MNRLSPFAPRVRAAGASAVHADAPVAVHALAAGPSAAAGRVPAAADAWWVEWLLRACALAACGVAVVNLMGAWWADRSLWLMLMLGTFESVTWGLLLVARRATRRDRSLVAIAQTGFAALYFVLMSPEGATPLVGAAVGVALQGFGAIVQFAAKWALGRSIGLLPALRGIVTTGPYRLVRHPVYLGYLVIHLGFLLTHFSPRNAAVLAALYVVQVLRIRREEAVLAGDADYRAYQRRVRWRMVPGVY